MKTLSQILKLVKDFLKGPEPIYPKHVFNCRDLAWISNILCTRFSQDKYVHHFFLHFSSGLVVKICQDTNAEDYCPELEKTRKLFINNIGSSYVSIEYPPKTDKEEDDLLESEIYIMSKNKKKLIDG